MKWWIGVPDRADANYWGVLIHRHEAMADWHAALARVPELLRADAKRYLRDVSNSTRKSREAKRDLYQP